MERDDGGQQGPGEVRGAEAEAELGGEEELTDQQSQEPCPEIRSVLASPTQFCLEGGVVQFVLF